MYIFAVIFKLQFFMAQKLIQTQEQKLLQVQRLSAQQMLQVKLLEMPLTELEESVMMELDDNPALEITTPGDMAEERFESPEQDAMEGNEEEQFEREERADALDDVLSSIGSDDELPTANYREGGMTDNADYEEMVYGDTTSFYDKLKEQMGEQELTETQKDIMEYLIGSLDSDGLLRKDLDSICDELAIYHNIDVPVKDIEAVLNILQDFDPAGIGARSLQECLLLQIKRKYGEKDLRDKQVLDLTEKIITDYYDAFTKKHWNKIQTALKLSDEQVEQIVDEIRRLNPKPGSSLGETLGRNTQQITPDFIVDTAEDGSVSFSLNSGRIPVLTVSPSFTDMVDTYRNNKESMSRQQKEALLYAKEKVEKAQGYIEAIRQRQHTMTVTMRAIIQWQKKFFQDGDEADLKPMILKDIAEKTGLDKSTISRVSNIKYAQTKWGTFPLRFFFSDGYTTEDGEELSTRKMKIALKELIKKEDKQKPMSDDAITEEMKKVGFPIARRTVAKYREQLGIPVARLRKE